VFARVAEATRDILDTTTLADVLQAGVTSLPVEI
jgi:hypothetical protein